MELPIEKKKNRHCRAVSANLHTCHISSEIEFCHDGPTTESRSAHQMEVNKVVTGVSSARAKWKGPGNCLEDRRLWLLKN